MDNMYSVVILSVNFIVLPVWGSRLPSGKRWKTSRHTLHAFLSTCFFPHPFSHLENVWKCAMKQVIAWEFWRGAHPPSNATNPTNGRLLFFQAQGSPKTGISHRPPPKHRSAVPSSQPAKSLSLFSVCVLGGKKGHGEKFLWRKLGYP